MFAVVSHSASAATAAQRKPNVVVILTDDQGWGDLSINGNTNLQTPHVDSLARDGATFENFYVCAVCSPTRAEFLTGRYHPRGNVFSTSTGGERLDLDERTIAEAFQAAGYATAAFGKWHNGMQYPYHPIARGFDEFYGFCSGHWGHYFDASMEHNGKLIHGDGYVNDDFTSRAIDFIEQHRDQPFFCYLALNTPHSPMQVPDKFFEKFAGADLAMRHRDPQKEKLGHTRAALAMCESIDWNVGRLLEKLAANDLEEDTILVYFCDNGPNGWRWNGGMKGKKGTVDEGGVRSPCFVRWPGKIQPGTKIEQLAAGIDLLPTMTDLADVPVVGDKPFDGVSVKPLLLETASDWPERLIFNFWHGKLSVRSQRFRLGPDGALFDMQTDSGQHQNVASEYPQELERLTDAAKKWRREVASELDTEAHRPFPVGYPAFPVTHLPARDGLPHGNIRRSARPPNCSFFTNWTSTEDRITWDIEVATTGRYEATVYYTCAASNVGSTIELQFGDSRVQAKVADPHDPPLVGKEHDRFPRGESYVKDFRPMPMGVLNLQQGRGALTLRATKTTGDEVMDVRYVRLNYLRSR